MKRLQYPLGLRIEYFEDQPFDYVIATTAPALRRYVVLRCVIDIQPIGAVEGEPELIEVWRHGDDLCSLEATSKQLRGTVIEPHMIIRLRFDFMIRIVDGMRVSMGLVCHSER
jgi:hypothetical protein